MCIKSQKCMRVKGTSQGTGDSSWAVERLGLEWWLMQDASHRLSWTFF